MVSDIGDVLAMLGHARDSVGEAEKLVEIAERLAGLGIEDRAEIIRAAAQSAEDATGALAGALDAVDRTLAATSQAGGSG